MIENNRNEIEISKDINDVSLQNMQIENAKRHSKAVEINLNIEQNNKAQMTAGMIGILGFILGFILLFAIGNFTGVGTISIIIAIIISLSNDSSKLEESRRLYWTQTNKEYLVGFENYYDQVIKEYPIKPKLQSHLFIARNDDEIIFVPEISSYREMINLPLTEELIYSIDNNAPYGEILKPIKIKINNIRYFGITGDVENITNVSGGGTSYGKAVIGAALFGPVGAIVGSRKKIQTSHEKIDTREVELKYQNGELLETILFPFDLYNGLEQIIPELEINNIKLNVAKGNSNKGTSNQQDQKDKKDVLNELTKLKQLLDSGTITEEEFIKLKSEILNWNVECFDWITHRILKKESKKVIY